MKNIYSKTAITLVELIVATALVSVVVLGLLAVNSVLSTNNQDYGQRYLLNSETQATLNHILNNASLAVGSGTYIDGYPDQGILTNVSGDPNSFCIHQDPNNTPDNINDDQWLCYTFIGNPTYQIKYCTMSYKPAQTNPPRGAASCSVASSFIQPPQFLGSAYNLTFSSVTNIFSISIQNCLDDTAPSCIFKNGLPNPGEPANNPEVVKSGSAFPQQEGSG